MEVNINEVLYDGLNYIKRVNKNLHLITNAINGENKKVIEKNYIELKEGLEWIEDVLAYISVLTDINYSEIKVNKQNSELIIKQYSDYLKVIDIMFEQEQYQELSSSIESELPNFLKKLISLFNKINKELASQMN